MKKDNVSWFWVPAILLWGTSTVLAAETVSDVVATIENWSDKSFYQHLDDTWVNTIATAFAMCFASWSTVVALRSDASRARS